MGFTSTKTASTFYSYITFKTGAIILDEGDIKEMQEFFKQENIGKKIKAEKESAAKQAAF